MGTDVKKIKCKSCGGIVGIAPGQRVKCPGCGKAYSLKPAPAKSNIKPACKSCGGPLIINQQYATAICQNCNKRYPLKSSADIQQNKTGATGKDIVSRSSDHTGSHVPLVPIILFSLGGIMLLIAIIIFATGPYDSALQKTIKFDTEKVSSSITEYRKGLEKFSAMIAESEAETKKYSDFLREYDNEIEMIKFRLKLATENQQKRIEAMTAETGEISANRDKIKDIYKDLKREAVEDQTVTIARSEKLVAVILTDIASGSGFLYKDTGLVVTNYHVVEGSSEVTVHLQKQNSRDLFEIKDVKIIAVDADRDLALLQLPLVAPPEISNNGKYPYAMLRTANPAVAGEKVFAIGNPGLGDEILDYTVTRGIISNARRMIGKYPYLQTTAAINSGNSGGPLFDVSGSVIGVVTLKGVDVESVGFAIPAEVVNELYIKRTDECHIIKTTLSDWEERYRPRTALLRKQMTVTLDDSVKVPGVVEQIYTSADGNTFYLDFRGQMILQEMTIADKKLGRKIFFNQEIFDVYVPESSNYIYAFSYDAGETYKIDTKEFRITATLSYGKQNRSFYGFATHDCKGDWAVFTGNRWSSCSLMALPCKELSTENYDSTRPICNVSQPSFLHKKGDWAIVITPSLEQPQVKLDVVNIDDFIKDLRKLRRCQRKTGSQKTSKANVGKMRRLNESMSKMPKSCYCRGSNPRIELQYYGLIFLGKDRFVLCKNVYKLDSKGVTQITSVPDSEMTKKIINDDPAKAMAFRYFDNIFSATEDGKYAASCFYIYDTNNFKPVAELPFPCSTSVFSPDGKDVFLFNSAHNALVHVSDWKEKLKLNEEKK